MNKKIKYISVFLISLPFFNNDIFSKFNLHNQNTSTCYAALDIELKSSDPRMFYFKKLNKQKQQKLLRWIARSLDQKTCSMEFLGIEKIRLNLVPFNPSSYIDKAEFINFLQSNIQNKNIYSIYKKVERAWIRNSNTDNYFSHYKILLEYAFRRVQRNYEDKENLRNRNHAQPQQTPQNLNLNNKKGANKNNQTNNAYNRQKANPISNKVSPSHNNNIVRNRQNLDTVLNDPYCGCSIYTESLNQAYGLCNNKAVKEEMLVITPNIDDNNLFYLETDISRSINGADSPILGQKFKCCRCNINGINNVNLVPSCINFSSRVSIFKCVDISDSYLLFTIDHFTAIRIDHRNKTIYFFNSLSSGPPFTGKLGYKTKIVPVKKQKGTKNCGCFALTNLILSKELIEYFYNVSL